MGMRVKIRKENNKKHCAAGFEGEEGLPNHAVQVGCRSWNRQGNEFSLKPLEGIQPFQPLDCRFLVITAREWISLNLY